MPLHTHLYDYAIVVSAMSTFINTPSCKVMRKKSTDTSILDMEWIETKLGGSGRHQDTFFSSQGFRVFVVVVTLHRWLYVTFPKRAVTLYSLRAFVLVH